MIKKFAQAAAFLLLVFGWTAVPAQAYKIEDLGNIQVYGDFVLSQGKFDVALNPGEQTTKEITITNRSGAAIDVEVATEDFSSPKTNQENISLLGDDKGPYSLRDYLKPELSKFTLQHGERIILPVVITIPSDSQPGGLYAAVTFSAKPSALDEAAQSQVKTISRLASLFFVRVSGEANEAGELADFTTPQNFYFAAPVIFDLNFKNIGTVYLKPAGKITVKNLFGKTVYEKSLPAYYVMPGATRHNQESWYGNFLTGGIYSAKIELDRGYGNLVDIKTVYFAVLPPMALLVYTVILAGLAAFVLGKLKKRQSS
mgnify:CR=1 FL=1